MQAKIRKPGLVLFLRGNMHLQLQEDSLDLRAWWDHNLYLLEEVTLAT